MSSQINSSVYNEKKIAAYESLFKESALAKPQEVYLTVTVAHLFGQAYIMEQQGTKEGDPVYSRFVCPLEEITKVYINNNVKASPLFIQCDTDVKGVLHRKRIIVPCLENVASIVDQIKEVQAHHMEKYEAAQEREKQKKREFLEAARLAEQLENEGKKARSAEKSNSDMPKPPKSVKTTLSAQELTSGVEESFKALEAFNVPKIAEKAVVKPAAPAETPKPLEKIPEESEVKDEFPEIDDTVPAEVPAADTVPPEAAAEPEITAEPEPQAAEPVYEDVPEPPAKPTPEPVPMPEPLPETKSQPPIAEEKPVIEEKVPPIAKVTPRPVAPARVNPTGSAVALADFETQVRNLKEQLDAQQISKEEYAAEKKKLLANLY